MNNVILIGRFSKDVELNYTTSGTAVARGTIAVSRDYKNKDGSTTTDFIPIEIMGKTAEAVANYTRKGSQIGLNGSIRVERYQDKEGNNKNYTKVFVNSVQFLDSKNSGTQGYTETSIEDNEVPF